ncbi:MAG: sugar transferase [Nocardioidaceae bacterium]|nr:sugar transferase [Nocardioidaceae bacterium]
MTERIATYDQGSAAAIRTFAARRALRLVPVAAFVLDLLLVLGSVVLAALGRHRLPLFPGDFDVASNLTVVGPALTALWLLLIRAFGGYDAKVFGAGTQELKAILSATSYAAGLLCVTVYLSHYPLARGFVVLSFALGLPAVALGRILLRRALVNARARGHLQQRTVIVGGSRHVDDIAAVMLRERWLGYQVVGALCPAAGGRTTPGGVPVIGDVTGVSAVLVLAHRVDVLFVTEGSGLGAADLRRVQWDLETHQVQLIVAPSVTDIAGDRVRMRPVGGLPLMHLEGPRWASALRGAKRTFDVVFSALLLMAVLPGLAVAALWIRLDDGGPVLFRQTRTGRDGREFACLKLRTMVVDAESRLPALRGDVVVGLFKLREDPRVTRPGRLLRRFSVDELPQLLNVLRGDMSLVGPRPPLPTEVLGYDADTRRRLHVRPGMTGLWQVSGRSDLTWAETVRLDLYYVDNWSMVQDLSILLRTVGAVLSSRGAY